MRGKLIILFGIDGSGKTTILDMLKKVPIDNTLYTSCLKNAIFEEELYNAEKKYHFSRKEAFSREYKHALHICSVIYRMYNTIIPILDSGKNVILDRYVICINVFTDVFLDTSYQCLSRAMDCMPVPDLGIYFDTDIQIASARIEERNKNAGIQPHYSESTESLLKKKARYEELIQSENYRITKVNANKEVSSVFKDVFELICQECES